MPPNSKVVSSNKLPAVDKAILSQTLKENISQEVNVTFNSILNEETVIDNNDENKVNPNNIQSSICPKCNNKVKDNDKALQCDQT